MLNFHNQLYLQLIKQIKLLLKVTIFVNQISLAQLKRQKSLKIKKFIFKILIVSIFLLKFIYKLKYFFIITIYRRKELFKSYNTVYRLLNLIKFLSILAVEFNPSKFLHYKTPSKNNENK